MEALTVRKNGLKVCTAGVGLNGTLTVFIKWSTRGETSDYTVSVMGIDGEKQRFLNWDVPGVAVGDEIAVKLDQATSIDRPASEHSAPAQKWMWSSYLFPSVVLLAVTIWTIAADIALSGHATFVTWIFTTLAAAVLIMNHRFYVSVVWYRLRRALSARSERSAA